jgi:hypothetical protein
MDTDGLRHRSPARFVLLVFAPSVPFWILGAVVKTPDWSPILCRSETSWAYREMPGTWREHPKPPARAVEC